MDVILRAAAEALNYTREMLIVALIMARVMPCVVLTPYLGGKMIPNELKMGIGILLTIVLWPLARESITTQIPVTPGAFIVLMLKEVFIGFVLGFINAHIFWAVEMMGRIVDTVRGSSMAEVLVPSSGTRATPTGNMFYHLTIIIFLAVGGHHIFLEAFFFSFQALPLDKGLLPGPTGGPFFEHIIGLTNEMFFISAILAAPIVAATFITDVVFGILNRVAPQLNAYFMSMPVKAMAGVFMVLVALVPLFDRIEDFVVWSLRAVETVIEHFTVMT